MRLLGLISLMLMCWVSTARAGDGSCAEVSRVCVDGPSTKWISGVPVTRDCWKYENVYDCRAASYTDTCKPLVDKGCGQIGSKCIDYIDGTQTCSLYEQKYQCIDKPGGTSRVMDCGSQTFCMDGKCIDSGYTPDTDMGKVMTNMEVARQIGNYMDPNTLTIFNGTPSHCRETFNMFDCCGNDTKGGGDNGSFFGEAGIDGVLGFGKESVRYLGSNYVYDSLYLADAPEFMLNGFATVFGGNKAYDFTFEPNFSYLGMVVGYGEKINKGAQLLMGSGELGGGFYLAFDPYSLALSLAIMVVMELASCEEEEQLLSLRKGQNLCVHVGSFCSKKALKACSQQKMGYCCFNSRLARIIATAGRAQLGKSWGTPQSPDCSGFTTTQISQIDFSKVDFSEVIGEIKAAVKVPDFAIERAKTKVQSYYGNE